MILRPTERFLRAYRKLTAADRQRVDRALTRLLEDERHPSLRLKRMQGTAAIWEARASDDLRITFERSEDGAWLRNVGHHDATLRHP